MAVRLVVPAMHASTGRTGRAGLRRCTQTHMSALVSPFQGNPAVWRPPVPTLASHFCGAVNTAVVPPHKALRAAQGFNNEHPNAKRAAVMKKRDWVSALAGTQVTTSCLYQAS